MGASEGIVGAGEGSVGPRGMGLSRFIQWVAAGFDAPDHLAGWIRLVERADTGSVRGLCSVPVR